LKYSQPPYYHFSSPSIKLVDFAQKFYDFSTNDRVIDIFAGCGVIGLELFEKLKLDMAIDFCEIQPESVHYLKKNIVTSGLKSYQVYESSYKELSSF